MKINIVDAICGSGKTSAAINFINNSPDDIRFLYITPYLSEVERIINACPDKHFKQPDVYGSKLEGIKFLFNKGCNIVSTHSLFKLFDLETIDIIKTYGYTLIMDEVSDVVAPLEISKSDLKLILDNYVSITENNMLKWTDSEYKGKLAIYKRYCELEAVCIYDGVALLWMLPVKTFTAFNEIYVLTYMFDCQVQRSYYDFYNLEYNYINIKGDSVDNYEFTNKPVENVGTDFSKLIHIVDSKSLNQIGELEAALSKSWYLRNKKNTCMVQLKNNIYNFFKHIAKTPSSKNLWTTFVEYKSQLKGSGYSKGFLSCNARAINEYRDCVSVAYTINKYFNPYVKKYFLLNGIRVEEDQYALSELIQWIFRSALRDGKEITLYIPSRRMRTLLEDWIKGGN